MATEKQIKYLSWSAKKKGIKISKEDMDKFSELDGRTAHAIISEFESTGKLNFAAESLDIQEPEKINGSDDKWEKIRKQKSGSIRENLLLKMAVECATRDEHWMDSTIEMHVDLIKKYYENLMKTFGEVQ